LPHRRQLCEIAAENLCKIDSPIAREKASAYYLEQLRKLTPDSCEWGDLEFRLKRLNHDDRAEIDRIRREIVSQHDIIPEPQLEPVS
jgi:3-dehydroquinate dehydratase